MVTTMKTAQQAILHHLTATPEAEAMTFFDAHGAPDVWSFGRLDAAARATLPFIDDEDWMREASDDLESD